MATEVYLLVGLLVIAAAYVVMRVHQVMRFRGKMLVTCPETRKAAAVKVGLGRAVWAAILGRPHLVLCECSSWPEREKCEQDCLFQVERYPEDHRVWNVASEWFAGKKCVYCGKPIETLSRIDRHPALLDADKKTIEWDKLPAEKLPEAFSKARPVCWSCNAIETLVREHPDRVVFRSWERTGPLGEYTPEAENKRTKIERHIS